MTEYRYGSGTEPLTAMECERLRPNVNVAALERWLVQSGGECRRAIIAHFAVEVTEDDLEAVEHELGGTQQDAELPLPPPVDEMPPPECEAASDEGVRGLRFNAVPTWQPIISVLPPEDPDLLHAWNAIEPRDARS